MQCYDANVNMHKESNILNLLECTDEQMISELMDVTDEYVHKMQFALKLVPSDLKEANQIVHFAQEINSLVRF